MPPKANPDFAETPSRDLTPLRAIRLKCLDCNGESSLEVRLCPVSRCPLWPYRLGKKPDFTKYEAIDLQRKPYTAQVIPTAARAIKAKCKDCNGPDFSSCEPGDGYEWCPLFQYTQAHKKKRPKLSEEERAKRAARMRELHAQNKLRLDDSQPKMKNTDK